MLSVQEVLPHFLQLLTISNGPRLLGHAVLKATVALLTRIGTCGGIGLEPGSVVVTEEALDGRCRPVLDVVGTMYISFRSCIT